MLKGKISKVLSAITLLFAFFNMVILIITINLQKKSVASSMTYALVKVQIWFLVLFILSEFVYWILSLVINKEYAYQIRTVLFVILLGSNLLIPNLSIPHYYNKVSIINQVYSDRPNNYGSHQRVYQEHNPTLEDYDILFVENPFGEIEDGYLYSIDDICDIENTGLWYLDDTNMEHIGGNWYKMKLEFYP